MVFLRLFIFLCCEVPLALFLGFCRAVAERPIVQHAYYHCFIPLLADTLASILQHPRVPPAAAPIVAEGLNHFLTQTERVEQHVRTMAATVSKTQPDWARQQGKDFPLLLRSFFQGMVAAALQTQAGERSSTNTTSTEEAKEYDDRPVKDLAPTKTTMVMLNVSTVPDTSSDDECKQED